MGLAGSKCHERIAPQHSYTQRHLFALLASSDRRRPLPPPSALRSGGASDADSNNERDPATRVDLSDKVKDILARASNDQDVADRLKAFVESHRTNNNDGSAQDGSSSGQAPRPT